MGNFYPNVEMRRKELPFYENELTRLSISSKRKILFFHVQLFHGYFGYRASKNSNVFSQLYGKFRNSSKIYFIFPHLKFGFGSPAFQKEVVKERYEIYKNWGRAISLRDVRSIYFDPYYSIFKVEEFESGKVKLKEILKNAKKLQHLTVMTFEAINRLPNVQNVNLRKSLRSLTFINIESAPVTRIRNEFFSELGKYYPKIFRLFFGNVFLSDDLLSTLPKHFPNLTNLSFSGVNLESAVNVINFVNGRSNFRLKKLKNFSLQKLKIKNQTRKEVNLLIRKNNKRVLNLPLKTFTFVDFRCRNHKKFHLLGKEIESLILKCVNLSSLKIGYFFSSSFVEKSRFTNEVNLKVLNTVITRIIEEERIYKWVDKGHHIDFVSPKSQFLTRKHFGERSNILSFKYRKSNAMFKEMGYYMVLAILEYYELCVTDVSMNDENFRIKWFFGYFKRDHFRKIRLVFTSVRIKCDENFIGELESDKNDFLWPVGIKVIEVEYFLKMKEGKFPRNLNSLSYTGNVTTFGMFVPDSVEILRMTHLVPLTRSLSDVDLQSFIARFVKNLNEKKKRLRKFVFEIERFPNTDQVSLLKSNNFEEIELNSLESIPKNILTFSSFNNLKLLKLVMYNVDFQFLNILREAKNVKEIRFFRCRIKTEPNFKDIFYLPKLISIEFSFCEWPTNYEKLFDEIKVDENFDSKIESFQICGIDSLSYNFLENFLCKLKKLNTLRLEKCTLNDKHLNIMLEKAIWSKSTYLFVISSSHLFDLNNNVLSNEVVEKYSKKRKIDADFKKY